MFGTGGIVYMYLIYGMYWMMNIVTGISGQPQAVLIRGAGNISGPGRVTRALGLNGSFNGENLTESDRIWIEVHATLIGERSTGGHKCNPDATSEQLSNSRNSAVFWLSSTC